MFKHILIPTDGSELSQKAVASGIDFARSIRARVTIFTASTPFHVVALEPLMVTATQERYLAETESEARKLLQQAEDRAQAAHVACETVHVVSEHPYKAIIETAQSRDCDLIMMASHGRKGVAALVLGSETQKVLAHCKLPVMVWR